MAGIDGIPWARLLDLHADPLCSRVSQIHYFFNHPSPSPIPTPIPTPSPFPLNRLHFLPIDNYYLSYTLTLTLIDSSLSISFYCPQSASVNNSSIFFLDGAMKTNDT